MANRFWVGGPGTWDSSSTTHWSTTSGGSSGASAPTSSDNAIMDSNSGALSDEVTISGTVYCSSLSMTRMELKSTGSTSVLKLAGTSGSLTGRYSLTLWSGETHIEGDTFVFSSIVGIVRILLGAALKVEADITLDQVYLNNGAFRIVSGAWNANFTSFTMEANASAKLLELGNGSSLVGTTFTNSDAVDSTITQSFTASITTVNFYGAGETYTNVQAQNIYGSNTFFQLTCINLSVQFQAGTTQTITNTLVIPSGTSISSNSTGAQAILSLPGSTTYNDLAIRDISVSPTQYATNAIDYGNNTGWVFAYNSNSIFFGSNF